MKSSKSLLLKFWNNIRRRRSDQLAVAVGRFENKIEPVIVMLRVFLAWIPSAVASSCGTASFFLIATGLNLWQLKKDIVDSQNSS